MIPGTYSISDYGKFISDFKAFDSNGNELRVLKTDENTHQIFEAKRLSKITYWVDDTFDQKIPNHIYGMGGTSIDKDRGVVINGNGFFGYFDKMKQIPYEVTIQKPEGYFGSTAMPFKSTTTEEDVFLAESYNYLVDMPMLYCKPDTATVVAGNAEVLISVNSPSGAVTAAYIAENFAELLQKDAIYMGGKLPVDKYAFLMHFLPSEENSVGTGALEHNYSSLYVLPDIPQEQWIQQLKNIAAHEFFHIVTPLNIHSKEIHYFDFNEPEMSEHLWMYEGVTEYFAHHSQLSTGLTDLEHFLNTMAGKITTYTDQFDDHLPFTEMSKNVLTKTEAEYANVYQKGALIGFMVDVLLRKNSDGQTGIMDLMLKLGQEYGANKPFKDKRLFKIIANNSYPEVKKYLTRFVDGEESLPLAELFGYLGVNYTAPGKTMGFSYGSISLGYNSESGNAVVASTASLNSFGLKMGYKIGDEIVSINGKQFQKEHHLGLFAQEQRNFKEGEILKLEILRDGQKMTLSAPIEKVEQTTPAKLTPSGNATEQQLEFRKNWMRGAK
jgi:predicted metalloprotease with PDZ domain